ncbi:MAG: hypothetical protein GT597_14170 [Bacteroidales bacterium]|jgi:antibiotic biosynthesis monooxygenase (ABM) superfamily enzyme|nr:hypothetical protein [Bacteroidales bacterium]MZP67280.1 hypothetical protein [Bacteroidales bacterium]HNX84684.1 hypothetical protein [Bacteroidales bacterium]
MKTKVITEFVKMEVLQTTTEEQLLAKTEIINQFLRKQDGFIDAELVKAIEGNVWFLIYHIENFEKLKALGEKLRAMKLFDEIIPLIEPGSMSVSFYQKIKTW